MVSLLIFSSKQCIIKQLLDLVVGSIPILNSEFFLFFFLWRGDGEHLLSTHILFIVGAGSSLHTYSIYY